MKGIYMKAALSAIVIIRKDDAGWWGRVKPITEDDTIKRRLGYDSKIMKTINAVKVDIRNYCAKQNIRISKYQIKK